MSLSPICLSSLNIAYLNVHNKLRANHNAVALQYSAQIAETAQKHANYLATKNLFKHTGISALGENIAMSYSSIAPNFNNCSGLFSFFCVFFFKFYYI